MASDRFMYSKYLVRRKIFSLLGTKFHIYDPNGEVVFYSKMKSFRLREDIRLYTGEDMRTEVLMIKARRILDFSAGYDVIDSEANEKVGALKRRGFKSVLKDEWIFMDAGDREIGLVKEDSMILAFTRRFVTNVIPQGYRGYINGTPVCTFKQSFNPFVLKVTADFSEDINGLLDKRLGIAAAVLLCGIEGRQE
jgi:Uncharacterized conserved protein